MNRLTEDGQRRLVGELVEVVKRLTPEWTSSPDHDPGITFFELFAWLADIVQFQQTTASVRKRVVLARVLEKLKALSRDDCANRDGLTRPRYFAGQLLTASDFQTEQDYFREKIRRQNRCMYGYGIVSGLQVTLDSDSAAGKHPVIRITPGCAIDRNGELLTVCEPLRCALNACEPSGYVIVRFFEATIDPLFTAAGANEPSRIKEEVSIDFVKDVPTGSVAIARLERAGGTWLLDSVFQPNTITRGISAKL
jgi:hypothetical protein